MIQFRKLCRENVKIRVFCSIRYCKTLEIRRDSDGLVSWWSIMDTKKVFCIQSKTRKKCLDAIFSAWQKSTIRSKK
jgi:hypothetical protein